jgi:hypothetical protein
VQQSLEAAAAGGTSDRRERPGQQQQLRPAPHARLQLARNALLGGAW